MTISGRTPDGRPVVRGLFHLVGTVGLPIDVLLEELHERGVAIDMPDFIAGARRDGWKDKTILSRFRSTRLGEDERFMATLAAALRTA